MRRNRARPRITLGVVAVTMLAGIVFGVTACGSSAIPNASDAAQTCRSVNQQLAGIAAQTNQVRAAAESNPVVAANGFAALAKTTADLPDCTEVGFRRAREAYLRALRAEGAAFAAAGANRPANPASLAAADAMLAQAISAQAESAASQSAEAASQSAQASPTQP